MILLVSCFRDSLGYVERYARQVARLRDVVDEPVHVVAVEGDSEDETYKALLDDPTFDTVLKAEHGGPKFGSVIHPLRWRQLSVAGNAGLCAAQRLSRTGDRTVYVESDLIWDGDTLRWLVSRLEDVQAVAPMSMMGARFYDTYGHVMDGKSFEPWPPFYPGWEAGSKRLSRIDSAGSCFALTDETLRVAEFSAQTCIRGIGASLRNAGYDLWIDPSLEVQHP